MVKIKDISLVFQGIGANYSKNLGALNKIALPYFLEPKIALL